MITCPWCGTNYVTFQSNCTNCGGPISLPAGETKAARISPPPPSPRPISRRYAWRLLSSDGWAIVAMVFLLLGVIFSLLGVGLTLGVVTAFVGIPFAGIGSLLLGAGLVVGGWRYQEAQQVVEVLRVGQAVEGQIVQVEENPSVQVNGRNPWMISYRFHYNGQDYAGKVTTLNTPGAALQPGQPAYVLYLPQTPARNVLYPHP
jgi:hypothetical protein